MTKFTKEKVLLLHQYIAAETGGSVGVKDEGLLESALQSAFATFDGRELYPTKEEKAARIGASLVANRSFFDGDKRIGMYVMLTFLEVNGTKLEGQHRSVYFAERMAERLAGTDGVAIEVSHVAKPHWK